MLPYEIESYQALPGEVFKEHPEIEHLEVSNLGRIRQQEHVTITSAGNVYHHKAKILHQVKQTYLHVTFHNKTYQVHRLVARCFCPGYSPELTVNHIDGNKHKNIANNLEWVTQAENNRHAVESGLWKVDVEHNRRAQKCAVEAIKVRILCVEDDKLFPSYTDARKHYGLGNSVIQDAIKLRNGYVPKVNKTFQIYEGVAQWQTQRI